METVWTKLARNEQGRSSGHSIEFSPKENAAVNRSRHALGDAEDEV